mgnify:CR=1 FL=1|tara:strand:+ start:1109 stop:1540 length:432 start_codon:yes stop_codon:yes gene_type:complete
METMTKIESKMVTFKGPKNELVEVLNGLYSTAELKGKKFALVSSKNIQLIKTFLQDVEELAKPSPEFITFAETVKALNGDKAAIDAAEAKEPELVKARQEQLDVVNQMLAEEAEIKLFALTTEMLPEDIVSHQITLLNKILID